MFRKSLYLASALTGALLWSVAAQAAPGQAIGNVNMRTAQSPAGAVVDIAGRRIEHRRPIYRHYGENPYAYYNPYAYDDFNDDGGAYFGGFGRHGGFGDHGGGFGGGFGHGGGGHGGGGGMGGGHGGGGGGGGHGR